MNFQKASIFTVVGLGLFFSFLLSPVSANAQSFASFPWGAAVDGLQMSVSTADSNNAGAPKLQIFIRNAGENDAVLNLGTMLANGKVQSPDKISFTLTDDGGKTHKFDFFDGKYFVISGRVDDYIVPLRAGSLYGLEIGLDKLYSSVTAEPASKLPAGKYQLTAQFDGDGAMLRDLSVNSWRGRLQSNRIIIEK